MKSSLLFLLVLGAFQLAFSQANNDSLYSVNVTSFYGKAYQYIYSKQDSAYYYFNKINKEAQKHHDFETFISSTCASNKTAAYFYDLEKMKHNLSELDSVVSKHHKELKESPHYLYYINTIDFDRGLYYFRLNNYSQSRENFTSIITSIESLKESELNVNLIDLITSAYSFIAKMYTNDGKFNLAKDYYVKNIQFLETKKADDISKINRTYSLLAEVLKNQNQIESSNVYFKKSLAYNLNNHGGSNNIITEANHLLDNYLSQSKTDSAFYYLDIIKTYVVENATKANIYHKAKAKIHEATNNYNLALQELEEVLALTQERWKDNPHNDVAIAYKKIGDLHKKFNNYDKALVHYDLALNYLKNVNTNDLKQQTDLKLLKNKSEVLNTFDLHTQSLKITHQALKILDDLKPSFKNNEDKLFLMEEAFPVFESALEANFKLFAETNQDSLIDSAFYYSEKSKSVLLMESILSTRATEFANIPKKITEQEQVLKSRITHLEKELNQSKKSELESELFEAKKSYRELVTTIETEYKSYFDLKYNAKVITLKEVQAFLNSDTALVSYFYGNNAIYSITITKNNKSIQRIIRNQELDDAIISVYNMLSIPKSDLQELNKMSNELYLKVLAPSITNISEKNVIIISDGLLNYIPFSSLSINGSSQYVVGNYAISYVNSATLLKQLSEKESINTNVLAFAPSFNSLNNTNLLALPHNETEVEGILNFFNGETLTGSQASLQNFNSKSANYGILHFATHAILDDINPEYSYLAFQPNTTENNLLYVSDLYNLNLNTSLVALSACESGIGNLNRGEGFTSLARGFYFSGASSIASTLWKINDASSLNIMNNFYKNLSEGDDKSTALNKAQMSFLNGNSQNALAHPYYWSGFVISGNTSAIVKSNNTWVWFTLAGIGVLAIGFLLIKRRKSN
ncbi:CHAT domain-containing protein [Bizionia argentinensis JUB59]|uniref:CHAT domain-containing protein n=1 Tax=Bizionia argentinensis JUB59 TaxID=1046627 RepID=G2EBG0_9FLAO|nr:CHAT domain-containing tetratricopeptide repeat protein [Bizionia argentinensis]EGV44151.1 CHAT domain-containing protein [Bizionia argentinensis JUB59]